MISFAYNAVLLVVDVVLLAQVFRRPSRPRAVAAFLGIGFFAFVFAVLMGRHSFAILRLLSYGIFLHGPGTLLALGALLWKESRRTALLGAGAAALLLAVAADAFLIEPHWLEVTRVSLRSPKLRRPLRIALIADFQTDHIGDYERRVLARVAEERPDVILMAGDHLQETGPRLEALREDFRAAFAALKGTAPLGIYAVRGNIDPPDWTRIFDGLPVTALDTTTSLDLPEFRLTALAMEDSFSPNLVVNPGDRFHIVLGHSPDYALGKIQADLLLAGHTHGGQVRLPFIGPLVTLSRVPRSWAAGVTGLTDGRTLVVSRGTGLERDAAPRLRFLCRPQLVLIDVTP